MNEFDAIFGSAQAMAVFSLISAIGFTAMTLIAFSAWVRREWALLPAARPVRRRTAWHTARERS